MDADKKAINPRPVTQTAGELCGLLDDGFDQKPANLKRLWTRLSELETVNAKVNYCMQIKYVNVTFKVRSHISGQSYGSLNPVTEPFVTCFLTTRIPDKLIGNKCISGNSRRGRLHCQCFSTWGERMHFSKT